VSLLPPGVYHAVATSAGSVSAKSFSIVR
jgi:hypothetical protein